jgi:hypothetical protein
MHVTIASMHASTISGEAEVALATNCAARCQPIGGSDIVITIAHATGGAAFEALLAAGSCEKPASIIPIARFVGKSGARVHVNMPVLTLTSGKYLLVVERADAHGQLGGCGAIKRT